MGTSTYLVQLLKQATFKNNLPECWLLHVFTLLLSVLEVD